MISVFLFLTGLIFGSFANVVVLRFNTGESLVFGGSRCFLCQKRLRWFELLPIVSYIIQRGKCRSCAGAISLQYPLVELASGIIFTYIGSTYGVNYVDNLSRVEPRLWIMWITSAAFFWLLLVLSVYDIRHQILPDLLVGAAAIIAFISVIVSAKYGDSVSILWRLGLHNLIIALAAGAALFLFFWVLWFFSRGRAMGLGDAKLAFAIGVFLGLPNALVAIFLSFWIGAVVGIGWVATRSLIKKRQFDVATLKMPIPFGPFLAVGAFIAYAWGGALIEWYLRLVI